MKNKTIYSKLVFLWIALIISLSSNAQDSLKVAPEFTLSDINDNKVSLSDFKGKVVYIDFWATWCKPCVEEIPAAKELHEKFKDNPNIVFVNISFDQDVERWKKKVKAKKMSGIQLNSPEGGESKVMMDYNIKYIPHFMIIDKNGKVFIRRSKKPSQEGIEEELNNAINQ